MPVAHRVAAVAAFYVSIHIYYLHSLQLMALKWQDSQLSDFSSQPCQRAAPELAACLQVCLALQGTQGAPQYRVRQPYPV